VVVDVPDPVTVKPETELDAPDKLIAAAENWPVVRVAPVNEFQVPIDKESNEVSEAVKAPPAIVLLAPESVTTIEAPSDEVALRAPAEF
jgi:hypothetical protein